MWLIDVHLHSFSYNSISKWRKLFFRLGAPRRPSVWSDPLPWWVLWMDTQEVTPCLLLHQGECPSLLSHLVPRVHPICPLTCHPCPWGHHLLMVYEYLMDPRPLEHFSFLLLCAETWNFWQIFIHLFSFWMCRTPRLVKLFCVKILIDAFRILIL